MGLIFVLDWHKLYCKSNAIMKSFESINKTEVLC